MARQIQQSYPADDPLIVGEPDGIVRPARMLCHAAGVRINTEVYVTGDLVEASIGRLFEIIEGEVFFDQEVPPASELHFTGSRTEGPESGLAYANPTRRSRLEVDDEGVHLRDRVNVARESSRLSSGIVADTSTEPVAGEAVAEGVDAERPRRVVPTVPRVPGEAPAARAVRAAAAARAKPKAG